MSKKVLIVSSNGPEPSFGGGQRNILIGKLFESLGFDVEMVLIISKEWGTYNENSNLFNEWNKIFKIIKLFQPSFRQPFVTDLNITKYLRENQKKYDWIIFRYEKIAFKSGFYFLKKSKVIIDFDDFEIPTLRGLRMLFHFNRHIFQYFRTSKCFYLNQIHRNYFFKKGLWVPNIPLADYLPPSSISKFLKNRSEYPSILHFVKDYNALFEFLNSQDFKKIINVVPEIKFIFISKKIDKEFVFLFSNINIEWIESPENIQTYYSHAWMSLILEKKNHGTHIKFIESIYYLTPVVGFKDAFSGYEVFLEYYKKKSLTQADLCEQIHTFSMDFQYTCTIAEKQKIIQQENFSIESLSRRLKNLAT